MKTLKKGIRLSDKIRQATISSLCDTLFAQDRVELELEREKLTAHIAKFLVKKYSFPEQEDINFPEWFEAVYELQVFDGVSFLIVPLSEPLLVPYAFTTDMASALESGSALAEVVEVYEQQEALGVKTREKEKAMWDYLSGFRSLKDLLHDVPDIEEHLPNDCFEFTESKSYADMWG